MLAERVHGKRRIREAMQFLVDTDWTIDYLNGVSRIVENLNCYLLSGVGISIISVAELYEGVFGANNPVNAERELDAFLDYIEIVPLDDAICRIFAAERRRLRVAGTTISDFDLLIGSTALRHNLTLLTNNRRHFNRVQDLNIISV